MTISATEQFARDLNFAWYEGRYDDLERYYHPDVVMSVPGCLQPVVGRAAMLETYREFAEAVKVHAFSINQMEVFAYDGVELCHLDFEVDYETSDGRFQEQGRDVYVIKENAHGEKRVVWRTQQRIDYSD